MKEMRLHGRGGQGVVLAGNMLATALALDGKSASVIPTFGGERRGAPVSASLRFDDKPIRQHTLVYAVDGLIAFDPVSGVFPEVFSGLKPGCIFLINRAKPLATKPNPGLGKVGVVDATGIALQELGAPIPNTSMLGAFAAFTGWVSMDSVLKSLKIQFSGDRLARNLRAAERGFAEVRVMEFTKEAVSHGV
ncbi:MAG: 2-oxoacid:acceptor oxidoreductase family protein [Chloroflexi bacterium]|nr:2-oxoacid:acceptor oxidoreductase family protein [Chloroflexota bacterium]